MMDPWDQAINMRGHGATWADIERATGLTFDKLKWRLDPAYRAKRLNEKKNQRGYQAGNGSGLHVHRIPPIEAARLLASIPRDTRSLTAKICGDPLPTRSALDRRGH